MKRLGRIPVLLALLFCLVAPKLATAAAIYTFSLPANGAVSAFSVELTSSPTLRGL
jgi:hypothetical protein